MHSGLNSSYLFAEGELRVRAIYPIDLRLLAVWLADPEVAAYYGGRDCVRDQVALEEEFLLPPGISTGEQHCLVEWEGAPAGYLQFYPVEANELLEYGYPLEARLWGMDLFLGEPRRWNRGIGTAVVHATVAYLWERYHPEAVVIDPQVANARAVRCYEKAGFERVRHLPRHEWHEGAWRDCWLMAWVPPA